MKRLQDFILENIVTESSESKSKTIVFNLTDMDNGEETVKSFENMPGVSIDGQKVTVEVTSENFDKLDTFQDIMQQFIESIRKSTKRASDEQYAQKTKSLEDKMNEFNDFIDELSTPEEDEDKDKKDDDKKEDEDKDKKDDE